MVTQATQAYTGIAKHGVGTRMIDKADQETGTKSSRLQLHRENWDNVTGQELIWWRFGKLAPMLHHYNQI
jgi:hypothetical protein